MGRPRRSTSGYIRKIGVVRDGQQLVAHLALAAHLPHSSDGLGIERAERRRQDMLVVLEEDVAGGSCCWAWTSTRSCKSGAPQGLLSVICGIACPPTPWP